LTGFLKSSLIEVKIDNRQKDPKGLVEMAKAERDHAKKAAKRERDDSLLYDGVWCVFDVDQHTRLKDAIQQATACAIDLAVSNPCFELWLLIHFRDQTAYISGEDAQSAVKRYIRAYHKKVDYSCLAGNGADAINRAKALEARAAKDGDTLANPTTGVWRLVAELCEQANFATERL
jgi:hypothetical protein